MSIVAKQCNTCKQMLPLSAFHKRPTNRDGLTCRCKQCTSAYSAAYREKKGEQHLSRRRELYALRRDKERAILRERYAQDPEKYRELNRKYRERYRNRPWDRLAQQNEYRRAKRLLEPEKFKARTALTNAVKAGKIQRRPCVVCGGLKSEGHHEDYSKPLDVVWLCRKHHMERHRKYPGKQQEQQAEEANR